MERRKFLEATTLFPFLANTVLEKRSTGKTVFLRHDSSLQAADTGQRDFFYRPVDAWAADFIPLYDNGTFHLFFLLDWRDSEKYGEGTPWYRVSTNDFVHFKEHGEMLPRGNEAEQDLYVFTGSAIKANGQYHIFYTGHNPHLRKLGKPEQGIMHAVSDDLVKWKKIPEHTFFAPGDKYEPNDWRDAFVFWNDETKEYNMLLAARFKDGIPRRRGLTVLCASKDLAKWEVRAPFYAPDLYFTHECPDLFKMGDWWYLLFSEFTDLVQTRYRMSRSLQGPWIIPERDSFDGHAFYAAKTASDGKRRFIFGWNPTRSGSKDSGSWDWGGNLVVHEIRQQQNGDLTVRVPETVANTFSNPESYSFNNDDFKNGALNIKAHDGFKALAAGKMPDTCNINATIEFEKDTKECGLMLRCSDDLDKSYYIRLEPRNNRLVFDMWPRNRSEVPHMAELDRPIELTSGSPVHLQVYINGNKGVSYCNNIVAMNFRAYDITQGNWGVFVSGGEARFSNMSINSL